MKTELTSIRLRALEPEDLHLLYTIENEEELWDVSNCCTPISKFALKQYLMQQPQDVFQAGELRLVIEDIDRLAAVGLLDLTGFSLADGRAEVGIALLKEERGKGIGCAALRAIEKYAKRYLHLRMLFARISTENNPVSQSLFEVAGYVRVALLPQWHYYDGGYEDIAVYQKII